MRRCLKIYLFIKGARNALNGDVTDIYIDDKPDNIIDGKDLYVAPSFCDLHVHFRDPGFTHKEDIESGTKAAFAGGVTAVVTMPNTNPTTDNVETIKYILDKASENNIDIFPCASMTKDLNGVEQCDYDEIKSAGAVCVSDDGRPVESYDMMKEVLKKAFDVDLFAISHAEDLKIIDGGIINKGMISETLNVKGMDRLSEDTITAREIEIAEKTDTRIHIAHVSTKGSVEIIRKAKKKGIKITCETCPHYFIYTDEKLLSKNANFRMNPPLREEEDILAIIEGIKDGTIDIIVTDHAPHTKEEKADFYKAPNGILGLQTSFIASYEYLVKPGIITLKKLVEMMSITPRKLINKPINNGDLVVFTLNEPHEFTKEEIKSKSENSPFIGEKFDAKIKFTIKNNKIVYKES